MGGDIVTHQLDAEPTDAVARDVEREQSSMADLEAPVDVEQRDENQ